MIQFAALTLTFPVDTGYQSGTGPTTIHGQAVAAGAQVLWFAGTDSAGAVWTFVGTQDGHGNVVDGHLVVAGNHGGVSGATVYAIADGVLDYTHVQRVCANGAAGFGLNNLLVSDDGKVSFPSLPTADPLAAGQLWNDAGTLKVSAG